MATLSTKLTVTSSDARSDSFSLTLSDSLTVTDPIETGKRNVTTAVAGGGEFVPASDSNTYYVYLKNLSVTAAEKIYIRTGASDSANIHDIGAGEFIFFSWSGDEDLNYDADSGTPVMEIMLFEV